MQLRKEISKPALLMTAVGGIIGSGWLLGPFYTAKIAGPAAIIAWLIGGLLMMIIALTFAELATTYPVAGGIARFAQFSHGTLTSFTMSWISWLAALMVAPIETMAAMQYAGNYFPALIVNANGAHNLTHLGIFIAACLMLLMCSVNFFSVKHFAKSNTVIVIWKLIIPVVTVFILFFCQFHLDNFTQPDGFAPFGWHSILASLPTAGVIFSFIGYSPAIQLAEEAKNPQKAIPFAIIGSLCIAIILYIAIETAFIGAINPKSISHGWQNLHFSNDAGPVAGLLTTFGITTWLTVIYADAIISPLGTAYIYTASTARLNIAMSENGYFPSFMQKLNQHHVPWLAILINFTVGILFFLPFPGWQSMVSFLVSCFVLAYAVGPLSCAVLRKKQPDIKRPFKLPMYHLCCFVAFYICNLIVFWTGFTIVWKMLVVICLGYAFLIIRTSMNKQALDLTSSLWLFPYLSGMGLLSFLGSFGGINAIHFGYDFGVLLIYSLIIYWLALQGGYMHKV